MESWRTWEFRDQHWLTGGNSKNTGECEDFAQDHE